MVSLLVHVEMFMTYEIYVNLSFSYFTGCVRKVFENVISILFKGL